MMIDSLMVHRIALLLTVWTPTLITADLAKFMWSSTGCAVPYDHCDEMELCAGSGSTFGLRIVGGPECSLQTAPLLRMQPGENTN